MERENLQLDSEIQENYRRLHLLKQQVFLAFAHVKLEDGIGFFEAGAIDDYFKPTDKEYQEEKARDEREDWTKVYAFLENLENFDQSRDCFMDAKGLHFYLPIILLLYDNNRLEILIESWIEEKNPKNFVLKNLLTDEQKMAIIATIEYEVDYDRTVEFYENFKGQKCHNCGKIHCPESYTREEAIAKVESSDEFLMLQKMKNYFNNK